MSSLRTHWVETAPGTFERDCLGQENSASYNQNVMDGHTEVSISIAFTTNIEKKDLIQRTRNSWLRCRIQHPEIGIEVSTDLRDPQTLTYHTFKSNFEAQKWLEETLVVVYDKDLDRLTNENYNRRLPTRAKNAMLYLNVDTTGKHEHGFIYNVSHCVIDAFSIQAFLYTLVHNILDNRETTDIDVTAPSYKIEGFISRLPVSPITCYEEKFNPTEADREKSLARAQSQIELMMTKISESVAIQPLKSYAEREHWTHCDVVSLTPEETLAVMIALKQAKISITYAGAAATILSIKEVYGKGTETGAMLGMTRNARKWLETETSVTNTKAIPMATDVVFLWIPFEADFEKKRSVDQLLGLSYKVREQMKPHVQGPHYLASTQFMSDAFVQHLHHELVEKREAAITSGQRFVEEVGPTPPGFSPVGMLKRGEVFPSKDGKDWWKRGKATHGGRQINASPWVGLYSDGDRIQLTLGFDSKYHDPKVMRRFLETTKQILCTLINDEEDEEEEEEARLSSKSKL